MLDPGSKLRSAYVSCKAALAFIAIATLTIALTMEFPAPGAAAGDRATAKRCDPPPLSFSVTPAEGFNAVWAAYGSDNSYLDDWTGADGTYSTGLPDGRVVWSFSDTFLGKVRSGGGRPPSAPLINNDFVVQEGAVLTETLHGGTSDDPASLVTPAEGDWYWVGDSVVEGDRLRTFVVEFTRTGPGGWDWAWSGTAIASFLLPGLTEEKITPVTSETGVMYGAAVLEEGPYTYVYGVEDHHLVKYLHVARAPRGSLLGPWEFFDGSGWSGDPADSSRLLDGVDNGFSVVRRGGLYLLLTQDTSAIFSGEMVAYTSCSPVGPWMARAHVYWMPENGDGDRFTYGVLAHPEFTGLRGLLVSYNVNTFDATDLYRDVTIYRPRFLRVTVRPAPG